MPDVAVTVPHRPEMLVPDVAVTAPHRPEVLVPDVAVAVGIKLIVILSAVVAKIIEDIVMMVHVCIYLN